ncbi:serine protease [Pseudonocardiaceae bacterium YIM PH 21723]|nr:serine protease [Pseudonocardiaceae bacterium YIM PH 21723]
MNWVDLFVILLAVLAAISGARQGMFTALASFAGVLGGAALGVLLAPLLIRNFGNVLTKVAFGIAVVVLLVALGETFGVWIGRSIRERIDHTRFTGIDNALGAVVQGLAVFVVAWLVAAPLTSVTGLPGLVGYIKGSTVLGQVDRAMPAFAKQLPTDLRQLLDGSGFPDAIGPFAKAPIADVGPPDPNLENLAVVKRLQSSVLKIRGRASSCSRALEGTGFVVAPHKVMTNAHVVAGTNETSVEVGRAQLDARVVWFDPQTDIAILDVPDLRQNVLDFNQQLAQAGQDAIVLGYPLDGPYRASNGRVRERVTLQGPDIYNASTIKRDVYTVRGNVRSGNSGGPLIDTNGKVIGVVFGAAVDDPDTGFVLTAREVADEVERASTLTQPVSTSRCAP